MLVAKESLLVEAVTVVLPRVNVEFKPNGETLSTVSCMGRADLP